MIRQAALKTLKILSKHKAASLYRSFANPQQAQNQILESIIKEMRATPYGQAHKLLPHDTYEEFSKKIPIVTYDDIQPWIAKQQADSRPSISPGETKHYEATSGSSGAIKWIPYNRGIKKSFENLFAIWAWNTLKYGPPLKSARTFISISPKVGRDDAIEDDREYLGGLQRHLIGKFFILPDKNQPAPAHLSKDAQYQFRLALASLKARDLEIISVWSPTYWLALLDFIQTNKALLSPYLTHDVQKILMHPHPAWSSIWPRVRIISCWAHGYAAQSAKLLAKQFPKAKLQPKGLLATEAPMTIPLWDHNNHCVPLLNEVFFEFIDINSKKVLRLQELVLGKCYELIISQKGGLLRYRLGDVVRCNGVIQETPTLEFLYRSGGVSDLVGEKLSEAFLYEQHLLPDHIAGSFFPTVTGAKKHFYTLITNEPVDADKIETQLNENYHYRVARAQGQLGAIKVLTCPDFRQKYLTYFQNLGMLRGDIKPKILIDKPVSEEALLAAFAPH